MNSTEADDVTSSRLGLLWAWYGAAAAAPTYLPTYLQYYRYEGKTRLRELTPAARGRQDA